MDDPLGKKKGEEKKNREKQKKPRRSRAQHSHHRSSLAPKLHPSPRPRVARMGSFTASKAGPGLPRSGSWPFGPSGACWCSKNVAVVVKTLGLWDHSFFVCCFFPSCDTRDYPLYVAGLSLRSPFCCVTEVVLVETVLGSHCGDWVNSPPILEPFLVGMGMFTGGTGG